MKRELERAVDGQRKRSARAVPFSGQREERKERREETEILRGERRRREKRGMVLTSSS